MDVQFEAWLIALGKRKEIEAWRDENPWVKEYAVFMHLKDENNEASYKQWKCHKNVNPKKIEELWNNEKTAEEHLFYVWLQYNLENQSFCHQGQ